MKFVPVKIVTNGNMTTTINSLGIDLNQVVLYSIQAVFTGSPVGTLKLQISNDIVNPIATGTQAVEVVNWTDYTGSSTPVTTSGNFVWNCLDVGYRWVRLVYTPTSGSGTLNATISGKAI